jgi:ATP-dependent DNA helicase RecG
MAQSPPQVTGRGPGDDGDPRAPDGDEARRAVRDTLLPPLRFASKNGFANLARLAGVEALVVRALGPARGRLAPALHDELLALARGFDKAPPAEREARARRMLALLEEAPEGAAAEAPEGAAASAPLRAATAPAKAAAPGKKTTAAATRPTTPERAVLLTSVRYVKGIGPRRAAELEKRELSTVSDLLYTLPRAYEDRRATRRIAELSPGALAVVSGTVMASGAVGFGGRGRRYEVALDDGSGQLRLVFFHFRAPEMQRRFARGAVVTASGEVQSYGPRLQMIHPRVSAGARVDELGGVSPVYPELAGLHPLELQRCVRAALDRVRATGLADPLPPAVRAAGAVEPLLDALIELHAPREDLDGEALRALVERRSAGHRRLAFEELFVLGLALALRRRAGHADPAPRLAPTARGAPEDTSEADALRRLFPWPPTGAQARAIREIGRDLNADVPMARLLQGDVGAGKTAVAAAACLRAVRAGHQAAFMAPTELLAEQHGRTLKKLFSPLGVRVEVITGATGKKARRIAEARLANRDLDIVVGTQALLSEGVSFARLGLCIVDEQHRFGVVQRASLRDKGPVVRGRGGDEVRLSPHLLVMTATPIPRSLALTVYGDLAVSVLDEMPPGRVPIQTRATRDQEAGPAAIAETLARGERAFVVYPLIDDSEKVDLAAATSGFEELRARFGEGVALLHGRMSSVEREQTMARFARGAATVLVSTTVVEVGVDVPEATLMVIQNAERFGLAQLHQLRGRVGRSARPSRCLLVVGDAGGEDAMRRVRVLTETNDGFRIAEEDLALRGPGDILGTRQAGLPSLAFSDLVRHAPLIELSRAIADDIVAEDPRLERPEHTGLRELVMERYAARLALTAAG